MKPARKSTMKITLRAANTHFEANGTRILFPGFLKIYGSNAEESSPLPAMAESDLCHAQKITAEEHRTRPPARFSEATLIQKLEAQGIGRPSTYASIISTLYERNYMRQKNNALIPTFTGIAVIQLLEKHFERYINYTFTADMEKILDEIAEGARDNIAYLRQFYQGKSGLQQIALDKKTEIDANAMRLIALPQLDSGYEVRVGRYGPYVIHNEKSEEIHVSIPEDVAPADLTSAMLEELLEHQRKGPTPITHDPQTSKPIYLLTGRYGPYLPLGESDEEPKPKRASVPAEYKSKEITPEIALMLLSLPRSLGAHPDSKEEIIATRGRFGPYIQHGSETRSLKKGDDVYSITHQRAVELFAEPKSTRAAPRSRLIRELGTDSKRNELVALYDGKYGPYLKVGKKNIALPDEMRTAEMLKKLDLAAVADIIKK